MSDCPFCGQPLPEDRPPVLDPGIYALDDAAEASLGPFQRSSDTSRKAAVAVYPRSGTQRWRVLQAIARAPKGITRDGLELALGLSISTINPRVCELVANGWVEARGERPTRRKRDAEILHLTPSGGEQIAAHE